MSNDWWLTSLNGLLIQHFGDKVLRCPQEFKADLQKGSPTCPAVVGRGAVRLGSGSAEFPGISWEPLPWVCTYTGAVNRRAAKCDPDNVTDVPAVTYFGFCSVPSDKEKVSITLSTAERQILGCCFSPSSRWDLSFYPHQWFRAVPI